jgi:hypothetical protein
VPPGAEDSFARDGTAEQSKVPWPLTMAPMAVPPDRTFTKPALAIVLLAVPPEETTSVPEVYTEVATATPPEEIASMPL